MGINHKYLPISINSFTVIHYGDSKIITHTKGLPIVILQQLFCKYVPFYKFDLKKFNRY